MSLGFGVLSLGVGVQVLGFRFSGFRFGVWGLGFGGWVFNFRFSGLGFRVQGLRLTCICSIAPDAAMYSCLGFGVWGLGVRALGFGLSPKRGAPRVEKVGTLISLATIERSGTCFRALGPEIQVRNPDLAFPIFRVKIF